MENIQITKNEENQRLDRFLRKYLKNASLSYIYKAIRKDIKVNGKRVKEDQILSEGDEISLYMDADEIEGFQKKKDRPQGKRQFRIAYEDENVLVVEKPFGLLTHGDITEKKNTLANQVLGYLIEEGKYSPRTERTFVPSPVNRLDRNTTGLVIFGKNAPSLVALNKMIRERRAIKKYYWTIVAGEMLEPLILRDFMEKDHATNTVTVKPNKEDFDKGKVMETIARPLAVNRGYSLVEVELITGRTHQIRAHLAKEGFPVIGDPKYGRPSVNKVMWDKFQLATQLLHAARLEFTEGEGPLAGMKGTKILSQLPPDFELIKRKLFEGDNS